MAKLIELHVQGGHFDHETGAAMTGALRYHGMSVKDAMTPLKNTFMLGADERLGFDTVAKIFKTGYSRIPVYEVTKSNVIGLLFVKDLIFLDPEDEIPVRNFVQIFGRGLHIVWPEDKLGNVLKLLKKGRSHMALVRDVNRGDGTLDPFYEIKGIITLEDIIEIILGDEIVDETDELVEVNDPGEFTAIHCHFHCFLYLLTFPKNLYPNGVVIWGSSYRVSLKMPTMNQIKMKQRAVCQDGKCRHLKALTGSLDCAC
jgi:metal transporter CNNM